MKPFRANRSSSITRLTALWALSESGLGGMMFALKIPLTGIFLGGFAVIIITLIAHFSNHRWHDILRATLLVMLVKAAASPHSPPPAYVAVAFQGLAGAFIYALFSVRAVPSIIFGLLAMVESATQKLIMTTLVYGKNIWEALDSFFQMIVKDFGFNENIPFSLWLIIGYASAYALWGIIVGWWGFRFSKKTGQDIQWVIHRFQTLQVSETAIPVAREKKMMKWGWLVIMLAFTATVFLVQGMGGKAIYAILRTLAAVFVLFYVINPLVKFLIRKWLQNRKEQNTKGLGEIMQVIPRLRKYIHPSMQMAKQESKGLKQYRSFVNNLIVLSLFDTDEDE